MASPVAVLNGRLLNRARLRHLQLLVAVADHGTLKRAAARVGMSQPAATQALSELERLLEVPLFDRHARGMRASEAGRIVLPVVRQMLQALEASVEAMTAQLAGATGLLRVGMIPAAAMALVTPRLRAIVARHPHLRLRLIEGTPSQLLNEVAVGGLDAALTRRPVELGTRFLFEPLARDEAIVIAGSRHPLAGRAQVSVDELASYPWMLPPPGVRVRELLDGLLAGRPAITAHPVSTSSPSLIACVLSDQRTLTLGPISAAEPYVRQGLVTRLPLPSRLPLEELGAVYPAASRNDPALAAFLELLREASETERRLPGTAPSGRTRRKG